VNEKKGRRGRTKKAERREGRCRGRRPRQQQLKGADRRGWDFHTPPFPEKSTIWSGVEPVFPAIGQLFMPIQGVFTNTEGVFILVQGVFTYMDGVFTVKKGSS
jgi:hypothetical protein